MIATFLRGLIAVARTIYRYERALLGARLVLPAFVLTILAIVLFPIFLFAIGPSRIAGGAGNTVRGIGRGFTTVGKGVGGGIGRFFRLTGVGITRTVRGVVSTGAAITRSTIAAVLVIPGAVLLLMAMLWYYPGLRFIAAPILLLPIALVSALLFLRAGRPLFGMFVVGCAAFTYVAIAWLFSERMSAGLLLAVLFPALIFFAAAREIRRKGSRWASWVLRGFALIFLIGAIVMIGSATLRLVSPSMAERVANYYHSFWNWSDRADTTEKAENSVEGYYNRLLAEKKRELDMLVAGKFPQAVIDAATIEYFALKTRADRAIADAKAAANPPAPVVAAAATTAPVQPTPPAAQAAAPRCPNASVPAYPGDSMITIRLNRSAGPFLLYWINETCERVPYVTTGVGSTVQQTFVGHVWEAVDPSTRQVVWGPFRASTSANITF